MKNSEQAAYIAEYLESKGLNKKQTLALLANIAVESGYTFSEKTEQKGRSDPAKGVFQFDPRDKGLLKIYEQYKKDNKKPESLETQLDFMIDSLKGKYKKGTEHIGYGNVRNFNKAATDSTVTTSDLTEMFATSILRPGKPHLDRRVKASVDLYPMVYGAKTKEEKAEQARTFPEALQ